MLLAIDAGNTNTIFAVLDSGKTVASWRCSTNVSRTGDEYFVWLSALMESLQREISITDVIVASVVPRVLWNLEQLCHRYFHCAPMVVGVPPCKLPVGVRVDEGAHVGADRLANAAAAFDLYGGDLIVVDFGTATNFDVVDSDGAYIGGAIAPGVDLSLSALHAAAAALPHLDVVRPARVVGTNTRDCMHAGIYWGYVGLIEGLCQRIKAERQRKMKVIGTGGLAEIFSMTGSLFDETNGDLTIHGLSVIHNANRS